MAIASAAASGGHQRQLAALLALERIVADQNPRDETARLVNELGVNGIFDLRNAALYVELKDGQVWSPRTAVASQNIEQLRESLAKSVVAYAVIVPSALRTAGKA